MKNISIAIALGLFIGWIISLPINPSAAPKPVESQRRTASSNASAQVAGLTPARAISALTLNQQRAEHRAGRPFNPYRERIFSADLLASIDLEQLIEALRAGQIDEISELQSVFSRIAELDPSRALGVLAELPLDCYQHRKAKRAIVDTWAKLNPTGMLDYLSSLPTSGTKSAMTSNFVNTWIKADPAAAMQHYEEIKNSAGSWESITTDMVGDWAKSDPVTLSEWLDELDPSPRRDQAVMELTKVLKTSDPKRAKAWAETIAGETNRERALKELK